MSDTTQNDTDRLPLLGPDALNSAQRQVYDRMMTEQVPWADKSGFKAATPDGRLLGPFNSLLYGPEVGQTYLDYFTAEKKNTTLTDRVHEIVILTVGAAWQSDYEVYAHSAVAKVVGLSEDIIQAITAGQTPEGLSEQEASAYEFTKQLAANHKIDSATYARASSAFGDKGLVDIAMLAGLYLMTCATLNAFEVPVP
ncbi:MAG: carboxymuconolactone decarboxylase family protein [Janthinobacterium lividum]